MITLVRIELLKLRTTPALWATLAVTLGLTVTSVFSSILLAGQPGSAPLGSHENASKVLAVGALTSSVMLVLGILMASGEDRHRTHLSTYLAEPRRSRVLLAKLAAAGGIGALGGAGTFGLTLAVALPLYAARGVHGLPVHIAALWAGTTLITACYGLLGVALGALTRNTVAAVLGGLTWMVVIEVAILRPLLPGLARWLPTGAGVALTTAGQASHGLLPPAAAALVLVGWAAAISVLATRVSLRREPR
jgi:ABC-type transport system involved in multi-copper enzyme maturation permease subunit